MASDNRVSQYNERGYKTELIYSTSEELYCFGADGGQAQEISGKARRSEPSTLCGDGIFSHLTLYSILNQGWMWTNVMVWQNITSLMCVEILSHPVHGSLGVSAEGDWTSYSSLKTFHL